MRRRALAFVILAGAAFAGDPAPAPSVDAAVDRAHVLVEAERWADGEAALRKLFVDFRGDPVVRGRLREIEDDLKVCMFRRAQGPLKGTDLFGPAAVKFSPSSREVELSFSSPAGDPWKRTESGLTWLDLRFESSLTIDADVAYTDADRHLLSVLLCYDIEKRGGYSLSPGYYRETSFNVLSAEPGIRKVARGKSADLKNQVKGGYLTANYAGRLTVTRTSSEISAKVGGVLVAKTLDTTYTSGYLGFVGAVGSVRIKGRLERHAYRKLVGEHYGTRFSEWLEKSWNRDKEIPAWAGVLPVVVPDSTLFEVPADCLRGERDEIAGLAAGAAEGEMGAVLLAVARAGTAPPNTARYLRAAAALGTGAYKVATELLDGLVADEPKLATARLLRGRVRSRLRDHDAAIADFRWVTDARPACGEAWAEIAKVEIFRGDLAAAGKAMQQAAEMGAGGDEMDTVLDWVHRVRRGPRFAQRFQQTSEHFVVASDHSEKVCADVAALLERMQGQYAGAVGAAPHRAAKSRVYVFSGLEGYMDYTADLAVDAEQTWGVYLPMFQELVLWIPMDMTQFTDTARHEGFHQYLHRMVERAPTWFNEGWAQVMGGGGPEGLRDAERDSDLVAKFMPVKELVALDHEEFMLNAGVTYTQSRYLVDYLRRTTAPKFKTLLKDYLAALASGLSQAEANAKVLEPVEAELEAAFRATLPR